MSSEAHLPGRLLLDFTSRLLFEIHARLLLTVTVDGEIVFLHNHAIVKLNMYSISRFSTEPNMTLIYA